MSQNLRLELLVNSNVHFSFGILAFVGFFAALCLFKILIRMFLVSMWFQNKSKYTKQEAPNTPTRFKMQDGKIP
jgi:hypothetical protein